MRKNASGPIANMTVETTMTDPTYEERCANFQQHLTGRSDTQRCINPATDTVAVMNLLGERYYVRTEGPYRDLEHEWAWFITLSLRDYSADPGVSVQGYSFEAAVKAAFDAAMERWEGEQG